MIYRDFKGKKISMLAMGTMRFPTIEDDSSRIDEEKTAEMFDFAIKNGVNYFDTAWIYHNGNSELVTGKILKKYPRDSFYLATKFPGYEPENTGRVEEIFETQLKKCQVDYFDFYLIHNVCDSSVDAYLDEKYGILEYLLKQKEIGRIKHLGFSSHSSPETMEKFLKAWGKHMEFCQLQINYLDWFRQKAKINVELVEKYNIPIWVMEPVRGGKLAKLEESQEKRLKELRPDESIPAWAFRYLQTVPKVTTILSGMSNMEQIADNLKTFESEKKLSDKEVATLYEIAGEMMDKKIIPCTSCRYCVSHCPKGLDIPRLLEICNEEKLYEKEIDLNAVKEELGEDKTFKDCISCKNCEKVCPQGIKISEVMKKY